MKEVTLLPCGYIHEPGFGEKVTEERWQPENLQSMLQTSTPGGMAKSVAELRPSMSSTDQLLLRAQVAEMESIRHRFRAIWFTDARRFVTTHHFQDVGAEFWLHERWLLRLGLLGDANNQLVGMNNALLGHVEAKQDLFPTEIKLVTTEIDVNELSFFMPQVVGQFRLSTADWVSIKEEEQVFRSCCFKLQRFVEIAYEGGMLWEDLLSGEALESQMLGKDDKVKYCVPLKEVFIRKLQTRRDVAAL